MFYWFLFVHKTAVIRGLLEQQWRIHRKTGKRVPHVSGRGQSCKSPPPHFLTHNDAIARFTSQSLGLQAYACNTDID